MENRFIMRSVDAAWHDSAWIDGVEDCYELHDFVWKGERDVTTMVTETLDFHE